MQIAGPFAMPCVCQPSEGSIALTVYLTLHALCTCLVMTAQVSGHSKNSHHCLHPKHWFWAIRFLHERKLSANLYRRYYSCRICLECSFLSKSMLSIPNMIFIVDVELYSHLAVDSLCAFLASAAHRTQWH